MNKQMVRSIATSSASAPLIFKGLASYERNRDTTDLRRLKQRLTSPVGIKEFVSLFQKLEDAGLGEFLRTKGEPPRFKWNSKKDKEATPNNVARIALGKASAQPVIEKPKETTVKVSIKYDGKTVDVEGSISSVMELIRSL